MKIAIACNRLEAFWNNFEPKGLILMCSHPCFTHSECIVAGNEEVLAEVKSFPGVVCF